jgi:formylglycine-generating enzyme required for sulfatase activity
MSSNLEDHNKFDRPKAEDRISPIEFQPNVNRPRKTLYQFSWVHLPIAAFVSISGLAGWFVITAKSVLIEPVPITSQVSFRNGFGLKLGARYLMRTGSYSIEISNPGYKDYQHDITVGIESSQVFNFILTKLPGDISIEANVPGSRIKVDDIDVGLTPLRLDIEAGLRIITVDKERYQTEEFELNVEGLRNTQVVSVELEPDWAEVYIDSQPQGAGILVDGILRGVTPLDIELLRGDRAVMVKLDGFKAWEDELEIKAGANFKIPLIALEKSDGIVFVQSDPPGASITVNSSFVGLTPIELSLAPDQTHTVTFFRNGYESSTQTIRTEPNQSFEIFAALTPITSKVLILAEPPDAEVYVDNKYRGSANQEIELMAATQEIEIRKKGFIPFKSDFTSRPGLNQEIRVTLLSEREAKLALIEPKIKSFSGAELTLLYPTEFTMGASRREAGRRPNETLREVNLNRPFYIGVNEITNAQFKKFNPDHSSGTTNGMSLSNQMQPVVRVTWEQAALFCNWLSDQDELPKFYLTETGEAGEKVIGFDLNAHGYRLPSEAEWAFSARKTDNGLLKYSWGADLPPLPQSGNFADISVQNFLGDILFNYNDNYIHTSPVGTFSPNHYGLYDLAGNAAEWVHDFYGAVGNIGGVDENPFGPDSGQYHTIRGSSWAHGAVTELRLSFRDFGDEPRDDVGFRIARFLEEDLVQ